PSWASAVAWRSAVSVAGKLSGPFQRLISRSGVQGGRGIDAGPTSAATVGFSEVDRGGCDPFDVSGGAFKAASLAVRESRSLAISALLWSAAGAALPCFAACAGLLLSGACAA